MQKRKLFVLAMLFSLVQYSMAQPITSDSVLELIKSGMAPAVSRLTSMAVSWLGVFAVIQFVITNYGLLKNDGDLQAVVAKAAAAITWVGVCLYIINNGPEFIQGVGDEMMDIVGFQLPSASGVIAQTVKISAVLAGVAVAASATPFVGDTIGQLLLYIALGILIIGLLFAFKIFMIQLELGLIALIAPLSFAFLGLSTLKDQGIAPFKSLLSFAYRVIILTIILSAFTTVNTGVVDSLKAVSATDIISNGIGNIVENILSALGAYILLAFLVWKSDGIASSMASGSTSLGNSDIASAAAAGAAAGAVVASAGAAAAGGAAGAPQSMANFMSGLNGGGSIKNAGGAGAGGSPTPFVPPSPNMSRSGGASGVGGGGASGGSGGLGSSTGVANKGASSMLGSGKPSSGGSGSGSVASGRYGAGPRGGNAANESNAAQLRDQSAAENQAQEGFDSSSHVETGESNRIQDSKNNDSMSIQEKENAEKSSAFSDATSNSAGSTSMKAAGAGSNIGTSKPNLGGANAAAQGAKGAGASQSAKAGNGVSTTNGSQSSGASQPASDATSDMSVSPASSGYAGSPGSGSSSVTSPTYGQSSAHGSSGNGSAPQAIPSSANANTAGSGTSAAIGTNNQMQQTLDQIAQQLATQAPKKPSLKDHLGEANRQVERERDTTHVQINTHNSD